MQFDIVASDNPTPEERAGILTALTAHNDSRVGPTEFKTVAFLLRGSENGDVVGGLWARTGFDWLFIELLAVPEALRGKGTGSELMRRAEAAARERGCVGVRLDTFSFQAPAFYQRLGYEVFGVVDEHPRGHQRFFLRKYL